MPTPNLSDEELDALFRRATEAYPEEDGAAAWQGIEQHLNKQAQYQHAYRQVLRWFAAEMGTVVVVLLLWFLYVPQLWSSTAPVAATNQLPRTAAGSSLAAAPGKASLSQPNTAGVPLQPDAADRRVETAATVQTAVTGNPVAMNAGPLQPAYRPRVRLFLLPSPPKRHLPSSASQEPAVEFAALHRKTVVAGNTPVNIAQPQNEPTKPTSIAENFATSRVASGQGGGVSSPLIAPTTTAQLTTAAGALHVSTAVVSPPDARSIPVAALADSSSQLGPIDLRTSLPDSTTLPTLVTPELAAVAAADSSRPGKKERPRPAYRFGVLLQYAPEVSTVRFSPVTKAGSNAGGQLEYFFTNRLSVNLGMLRAMKRYEARGTDYHARPAYLPAYVAIDEVDAVCRMVDIPLNVRYLLRVQPTYQLFASAGLSSLLMRDERYMYYYDYYNQPVQREWRVQKGSHHWLSVVNLSVGYEQQVAARWGLRAEPFVKIPLGGVGAGQVRLSSAGVFFGAQYRLLKVVPHPH